MAAQARNAAATGNGRRRRRARPAGGSTACSPRASALSRTRLKALILDGAVTIGARTIRDPGYRVNAGEPSRSRCRSRSRPSPAARASRSTSCIEDDEIIVIDKPAGLVVHPARGPRHRHAGQRADRPLRRQPVRHRRGEAAGHRASARQGHHRPDGGGQDRPRAPGAGGAVRRPRPHRAAAARLSGLRLGRAGAPEGHHRRADRPPSQEPRPHGGARQADAPPSPIGRCWSAFGGKDGKAGGEPDRMPAGNRPHPPDPRPSRPCRPSAAGRRDLRPGLQDQGGAACPPAAQEALAGLGRQALHAYLLAIEHPKSGKRLEFRSELPAALVRLHHSLAAG